MFDWIQMPEVGTALAYLIEITAKSAVVFAVAWLTVVLFRRASAAERHRIWLAAIVGVVMLPVLAAVLPSWNTLEYPGWMEQLRSPRLHAGETVGSIAEVPDAGIDGATAWNQLQGNNLSAATGSVSPLSPGNGAVPGEVAENQAGRGAGNAVTLSFVRLAGFLQTMHWTTALFWVWLIGAALVLFQLVTGAFGVLLLARRATPVRDAVWEDLADEIGDRLYLRRNVFLLKSRDTRMPMAWGGISPFVLLPVGADDWSQERKRCVLTHEFAHVKRWDCATQGIAQLACAVYWFNPLVWIVAKQLRIEREKACDDYVVTTGTQASSYAGHLIEIARSLKTSIFPPLGAVTMARPSHLEGRILSILNPAERGHRATLGARIRVAALVAGLVLPLAAMAPAPATRVGTDRVPSNERLSQEKTAANGESIGTIGESPLAAMPEAPSIEPTVADTVDRKKRRKRLIKAASRALGDEDPEIRRNAARILGKLCERDCVPDLTRVFESDPNSDVRRSALQALAEIGDAGSIELFTGALDDENPEVRKAASDALLTVGRSERPHRRKTAGRWGNRDANDDISPEMEEFAASMAEFGTGVARVTLSTVSDVSDQILPEVERIVSTSTRASLEAIDWDEINRQIQEATDAARRDIDDAIVDALIEVAMSVPDTKEGRRALRSLRRSDHPKARRFLEKYDR